MKNIFLTLIIFISSFNFVNSQVVISNEIYTVIYSEALQQPLMLSYEVDAQREVQGQFKYLKRLTIGPKPLHSVKVNSVFDLLTYEYKPIKPISWDTKKDAQEVESASIKCSYNHGISTSNNEDYFQNDYDKGHLASKETFKHKNIDCILNSYLNIALMHSSLNRGVWSTLEKRERDLEKDVSVTISLSFDKSERVLGGATIPSGFTKILSYYSEGEQIEEIYSFPNNSSVVGKDLREFKIN